MKRILTWILILLILNGCNKEQEVVGYFKVLEASETGIDVDCCKFHDIGIGIGVGDFNTDDLTDFILLGEENQYLFINKGDFKFEKNVLNNVPLKYYTSITVTDFNNDGWDDFVLASYGPNNAISFYTNQHDNTFKMLVEHEYENSHQEFPFRIALVDLNKDGFSDFHVTHWRLEEKALNTSFLSTKFDKNIGHCPDLFFINEKGKNISLIEENTPITYPFEHINSFGAIYSDLNGDNYTDLFVPNDFNIPDFFFKGGLNGFVDITEDLQTQTSYFSMGCDIADINNDGLLDIITSDMRRREYVDQKLTIYETPYNWRQINSLSDYDLSKQQVKNTLQINLGNFVFSEVSEMMGIDATDWTWGVLSLDFDNDGYKDLFYTTGAKFDYKFLYDYPFLADSISNLSSTDSADFINRYVENSKTPNYLFKNIEGKAFELVNDKLIGEIPNFSSGVVSADFNNDGRLELLAFNASGNPYFYENTSKNSGNYLKIRLKNSDNASTLQTKVKLYYNESIQFQVNNPVRGVFSSSEDLLHFGLDTFDVIDSIHVRWPNNELTALYNVSSNQTLVIEKDKLEKIFIEKEELKPNFFRDTSVESLDYRHQDTDYDDLISDILLPKNLSSIGPVLKVSDLDKNGFDDIIIGGSSKFPSKIVYQSEEGFAQYKSSTVLDSAYNDVCILIHDFDKDGKRDIFVGSGSNEFDKGSSFYEDRLYLNKGDKKYTKSSVTNISTSTSTAIIDNPFGTELELLFVGSKLEPKNYPAKPSNSLLVYEKGEFVDVTKEYAPELSEVGMVSDATWTDFNKDGLKDLLIIGEFSSPFFFENNGEKLLNVTDKVIDSNSMLGLWNKIDVGDFNNDGLPDYLFGNLGTNTRYKATVDNPLVVYTNDFDNNGSNDIISCFSVNGKSYPIKPLNVLKNRVNGYSKKYYLHSKFANLSFEEMYSEELLVQSHVSIVNTTESVILLSTGNGSFEVVNLPFWAQVSPINDFEVGDFNKDGNQDFLAVGNDYQIENERGRYTSQKGTLFLGDGNGNFKTVLPVESGIDANCDCSSIETLQISNSPFLMIGCSNEKLKFFEIL